MNKTTNLIIFIILTIAGIALDIAPIQVPAGIDKVYHFIGFFLITLSAMITFISFFGKNFLYHFMVFTLTFGALLAGFAENIQKFVPIRGCDPQDWFVNLSGIGLACIIIFLFNIKREEY